MATSTRGSRFDLTAIQVALVQAGFDGWLLYDFRGLNVLARRIVEFNEDVLRTRRWFYYIPARGEPRKLVHRIEAHVLDALPGSAQRYLRWEELEAGVAALLLGARRVAMEYAPRNANPYISRVDGGTIELVRSCGVEVVPSGDLVQLFEATWDDEQWAMHLEAAEHTRSAFEVVFDFIADRVRTTGSVRERQVQGRILEHFAAHNLVTEKPPICAAGTHSSDPHYCPGLQCDGEIRKGDFVLIDLWGKINRPRSVYSDLTQCCFVGSEVPQPIQEVFYVVAAARDAGIVKVREAFRAAQPIQGWEVDQAVRDVIEGAGYGSFFCHRTGHSIGEEVHGNGANMDNLETREERRVLPRTCFSIEPGIYLPKFGIRSEVNVFVDGQQQVHVTGGTPQTKVRAIL
jgi:Xaa-Pro aminopeptidase